MFGMGPGHEDDTKCSFETCMVEEEVAKTTAGIRESMILIKRKSINDEQENQFQEIDY